MSKKFSRPLRMCVSCRQRDAQENLIRLQCIESHLKLFKGNGRSFYLCKSCLQESKRVEKALMRQCKSGERDKLFKTLKEIITDDRKS